MPLLTTRTASPTTTLYYEEVGSGPPVVLIHGWPLSHRMWESQINAIAAAGFRVIAYDRRGFGNSDKPSGGYDYDAFSDDLHDLLTGLDLRDATIAGFSMGGGEVARYFGRHGGERVARAMLLGAVPPFLLKTDDNPHGAPAEVFDGMVAGVTRDRVGFFDGFFPTFFGLDKNPSALSPSLLGYMKSIAYAASPLATQRCIVAFGRTDFRADLAKVNVPTLVAHGDADAIVPIEISGKLSAERIKGSRYEVVKGAPHGLAATHADALNRLMVDFLKG